MINFPYYALLITCKWCGWRQKSLALKCGVSICKRCGRSFKFKRREGTFLKMVKGEGKVAVRERPKLSNCGVVGSRERIWQKKDALLPEAEDLDFVTYRVRKKDNFS